jgi:hypothetical protein
LRHAQDYHFNLVSNTFLSSFPFLKKTSRSK